MTDLPQPPARSDEINTYVDDLFDNASSDAEMYGVRAGRYRFPPPPGVEPNPRGWMRTSNLAAAFSDQRALQLWLERATLCGLLANEGLIFDELSAIADHDLTSEVLADIAERARTAAGADKGARKGTARHLMLEGYLHTGEINGHRRMRMQMEDLLEEMERHELDFLPGWAERVIWHPIAGGTMGRLDARVMCRRTGQIGVFDLKTQRRFWTYMEIAAQQACYDSAPWVWEGPEAANGRWVPYQMDPEDWLIKSMGQDYPAVEHNTLIGRPGGMCEGKRVALLAHMPSDGGKVQIHEVDLEYGARALEIASWVVAWRSRGKSVTPGRGVGGLRPMLENSLVDRGLRSIPGRV